MRHGYPLEQSVYSSNKIERCTNNSDYNTNNIFLIYLVLEYQWKQPHWVAWQDFSTYHLTISSSLLYTDNCCNEQRITSSYHSWREITVVVIR